MTLAEVVTEMELLYPVNIHKTPSFEAFCAQVARARDASFRIENEGLVIADEKGRPIPHPAIAIEKAASVEIRAWAQIIFPRGVT